MFSSAEKRIYKFYSYLNIDVCKSRLLDTLTLSKDASIEQNEVNEFVFSMSIKENIPLNDWQKLHIHIRGYFIQKDGYVEISLETQNLQVSRKWFFLFFGCLFLLPTILVDLRFVIFLITLILYYVAYRKIGLSSFYEKETDIIGLLRGSLHMEPIHNSARE